MSVQRGDLVAGRYRLGDPLGPAWRAHDEHGDVEVVLVPAAGGTPDPAPWRDRKAILAPAGTATGDHGAWLVTAPVAARTLADAVAQWGALPPEQVLTIAVGATAAVSGVGPHPAMTPDHILLTDDGKVLLLPTPTTQDALFELGAALFLAAEGHSPFEPAPGDPRQPNLAGLIRGLMQQDPDRAAALDRAHAELSRLGAPVETEHGADTLMEAQVASAEAAGLADAGDEPTHVAQAHDIPTQPMSVEELLAETGESAASGDAAADEASEANEATQAVSAEELLAESDDELPVAAADEGESADDEPTRVAPTADASAAADDEATRLVPTIAPVAGLAAAVPDDEPPPTKPEPIPEVTAAVAPPTQAAAAYVPPPTQAAAPVPPPQPQPQFQAPPQQFSAAPPTQAAAAYPPPGVPNPGVPNPGVPNPGAPNPWLQQQPPQPQNPWQNPAAPPGPPPGGGWGQPGQQPFYPMPGPPPRKNTGKTVAIVIGAVAAVAVVVLVVVLVSKGGGSKDKVDNAAHSTSQSSSVPSTNFPTGSSSSGTSSSSSSSPSPSDSSSSDTESPSTSESSSSDAYTPPPDLTSTPFDPTVLNEGATDKTPLTLEALAPQDFTDDKGVHYALKAGSIQPCVQTDMSANMKDILTSNSCTKEVAASYVDDSGQYLVSVKVLPLPDQHTATVIYNDLAKENAADFGIWCPQDGPGSGACEGDYRSATIKQYREQQHRYVILSVALAVNHSESSTITPWLDAAAKKAVDAAGPDNWSGNQ
ncbi:MAG: hypothetical protein HOV87_13415 [Catenulispora sp.]|nr:hypothetical protein [Catenulispora sp.]